MNEIPERPRRPDFNVTLCLTREIGLAAACMADGRVPRLTVQDICVYDDSGTLDARFRFPNQPDVRRVFASWARCIKGEADRYDDVPCMIYRAFEYSNRLVNIIRRQQSRRRPLATPEGFTWTINTKVAATALALVKIPMVAEQKLRCMVYYDGENYGFFVSDQDVVNAFADPEKCVRANPDAALSYIVAAFYHREHLRDLVNQLPKRHMFRDGDDVTLISENSPTLTQEIPCNQK